MVNTAQAENVTDGTSRAAYAGIQDERNARSSLKDWVDIRQESDNFTREGEQAHGSLADGKTAIVDWYVIGA